jgi:hypothetical protein
MMESLLEMPPAMVPEDAASTFRSLRPERVHATDPFDWSTDDSVLLGEQFATAVYRNKRAAIVIRQEGVGGDDDHFVILRDAEAARRLVAALLAEIKEGGGHG